MNNNQYYVDDDGVNIWIGEGSDDMAFPIKYNGFVDVKNIQKITNKLNDQHNEIKELRILIGALKNQNQKLKLRLDDLGVEYY